MDYLGNDSIQQGGRIKPFQSFARETARHVTGKETHEEYSATEFIWRWMAQPEKWNTMPMIPVNYRPLREELKDKLKKNKISPEDLLMSETFIAKVEGAQMKKKQKDPLETIESESVSLYEKAMLFREIATGALPGWAPKATSPEGSWVSLVDSVSVPEFTFVRAEVKNLLDAFGESEADVPTPDQARAFKALLANFQNIEGSQVDSRLVKQEMIYNDLKPFAWSWKFYLLGMLGFIVFGVLAGAGNRRELPLQQFLKWIPLGLIVTGFLIHSYGFYLRCIIAGRPPVSNMYESVIWVSWAVVLFSFFIFATYRAPSILSTSAFVAAIALLIAESFPVVLNPSISPLVPVLRSNLWLTVHVLTITLSYGAFALAWGLGHVVVFSFAYQPEKRELQKNLSQYLYRAIQIGVILLAAGTVLGGVWANYSWGRFWGWDPKETWALIALLGYIAVLHGRLTGWIRTFGFALGCAASFILVVMAWYGVNFVLAAGLHSYGFGGGGAPYVLSICLLDLGLLAWMAWIYRRSNRQATVGGSVNPNLKS